MDTRSTTSTHLTTAECWAHLENENVGRLAVIGRDGNPDIFPVNFIAHEGCIYIRTAPDIKMVRLADRPGAAFEVDGHTGAAWWSVVARGEAELVRNEVDIERSGVTRLTTASPRHKQHVIRLRPAAVTGRRFVDRIMPDLPKPRGLGAAPALTGEAPTKPTRPDPSRAVRPDAIPAIRPPATPPPVDHEPTTGQRTTKETAK